MPQGPPPEIPTRLPLATEQANRDSSTAKDAKLVNCYLESQPNGDGVYVIKRPGMTLNATQSVGVAGVGRGIFNWAGNIFQVIGASLYLNGAFAATVDATSSTQYRWSVSATVPFNTLVLSNGVVSYTYLLAGGLTTITPSANLLTPGVGFLDGTTYFMDGGGNIVGSKILQPTVYDPLNVIRAQLEPDSAVGLAKHLAYIIAFKQWSIEVFSDNGNPSGSPLISNPGAVMPIGCATGYSVMNIDGELYWIGATRNGSTDVYKMTGVTPVKISTPAVQKLIETCNFSTSLIYSWCYKGEGHTFYVITMVGINLTLAYDTIENTWSQWTDSSGNYVPIVTSTFSGTSVLLQHESNGNVYTMASTAYTDAGSAITVDVYTPEFDGKVDRRKLLTMLRFNSDQQPGSLLQVRCNDAGYSANAWTNFRNVDLASKRPILTNCGTFYKRAYHLRHKCNTPLRIYSVDVEISLGTL